MKKMIFFFVFLLGTVLAGAPLTAEKELTQMPLLKWRGTVASASKGSFKSPAGRETVCFTYPILYDANGKIKGTSWPRCTLYLPPAMRDWSQYDFFEFSVYTTFNRSDEEYLPCAMSIGGFKNRTLISFRLDNLRQNQWVKVSVPLREMKKNDAVRNVQFHLNARRYFPNDKLVLHFGDFKLIRLLQWQVAAFRMTAPAVFSGRTTLPVEFELLGPGEKYGVPFRIFDAKGKNVKDIKLDTARGFGYYLLPVGKLPPGKYTLAVFPDDKQKRNDAPFQVIAPPSWKN